MKRTSSYQTDAKPRLRPIATKKANLSGRRHETVCSNQGPKLRPRLYWNHRVSGAAVAVARPRRPVWCLYSRGPSRPSTPENQISSPLRISSVYPQTAVNNHLKLLAEMADFCQSDLDRGFSMAVTVQHWRRAETPLPADFPKNRLRGGRARFPGLRGTRRPWLGHHARPRAPADAGAAASAAGPTPESWTDAGRISVIIRPCGDRSDTDQFSRRDLYKEGACTRPLYIRSRSPSPVGGKDRLSPPRIGEEKRSSECRKRAVLRVPGQHT